MLWQAKHRHTRWSRSRRPPSEAHWMRTQCSVLPSHTRAALCLSLLACPGREVASTTSGGNPGTGATPAKLTAHPPPGALVTVPRAARTPFKSWAIVTRHLCHKSSRDRPYPPTLFHRQETWSRGSHWWLNCRAGRKRNLRNSVEFDARNIIRIQVNRADHRIS